MGSKAHRKTGLAVFTRTVVMTFAMSGALGALLIGATSDSMKDTANAGLGPQASGDKLLEANYVGANGSYQRAVDALARRVVPA